ncbi:MAG: hypothetical protein ACK4YP_27505, partial [Myxococcota bacterium]
GVAVFSGVPTDATDTAAADLRITGLTWGSRYDGGGEYYTYATNTGRWIDAGDLDGDGASELLVGDYRASAVYLFDGGARAGTLDVSDAHGVVTHSGATAYLGNEVSAAGDLDGDGYGDLLATAPGIYATYAVAGPVAGAVTTTDAFATFTGTERADATYAVDGAGDLDGDGADDLVLGAPLAGGWYYGMGYGWFGDAGAAFVFYGPTPGTHDPRDADAILVGTAEHELGYAVSGAGDLDADGFDDLIVGGIAGAWVEYGGVR